MLSKSFLIFNTILMIPGEIVVSVSTTMLAKFHQNQMKNLSIRNYYATIIPV